MAENTSLKILEYIKEEGPTNTFRLARELNLNRHKVLKIIKDLEAKEALEFKSGLVKFLKFPVIEKKIKKPIEIKTIKKPKRIAKRKSKVLENLQTENLKLKEKLSTLKVTIKELEQKAAQPKIIRRTIIKKVPSPPKIIKKTIIKRIKVPVIKTIIKKVKAPKIKKLPRLKILDMKSIQQLNIPKILKGGL